MKKFLVLGVLLVSHLFSDNQTPDVSTIENGMQLPFQVIVEQDFQLPNGIHSGAWAQVNDRWVFIGGRTNGLHSFNNNPNNFPPSAQNRNIFVVNPRTGTTSVKSLTDVSSGLSQQQIDQLSVTSPQFYQKDTTLYVLGGYGVDTLTSQFNTKNSLTALDLPGVIHWVENPSPGETLVQHIRETADDLFMVTGGYLAPYKNHEWLLIFGQNFPTFYLPSANGIYTDRIKRFKLYDDGVTLTVKPEWPRPEETFYRRRDLNIVPIIHKMEGIPSPAYVAFSGVFTETGGAWTVPVFINPNGTSFMSDPEHKKTFKQGMNNYICPTASLFAKASSKTYAIFFGGISYGYFNNGVFTTDSGLPFINQITTVEMDSAAHFKQYIMDTTYPTILSTQSNPGNTLLFGAGGYFIPSKKVSSYSNKTLKLDKIRSRTVIGHIVGGIESTLPNTTTASDSAASSYVFRVTLIPIN